MIYTWAFVNMGKTKGLKYVLLQNSEEVKTFTSKNSPGGMSLEYALMKENTLLSQGHTINHKIYDYIKQCNHNAQTTGKKIKTIPVITNRNWEASKKEK